MQIEGPLQELELILSQFNPLQFLRPYSFNINFNIFLPPIPSSLK
jgi:hypothetical protein